MSDNAVTTTFDARPWPEPGAIVTAPARLMRRRLLLLTLVALTVAGLGGWLAHLLAADGFDVLDGLILAAFLVGTPWPAVNCWNAIIGFALLHGTDDALAHAAPFVRAACDAAPVTARTAVVMTLRNEDPARALDRLAIVQRSLDATPWGARFDLFVLSDTSRPEIAAAEERGFAAWRAAAARPERLHYRRRTDNRGFKAGNLRDFVEHHGAAYDFMLPLDADSLMTAAAILRLVRIAEANPRIGILQSLVVGLPADSLFARVFQFGMRHGMRCHTLGGAWWQGDCGPYWGHNALVRVAPFAAHCALPLLPGPPPLGGPVLSHDQIEAALMRRAGFEVRVLPVEGGSFEDNPPSLPDFLKRDLRWCQGNMQYLRLLGLPGLLPTSRIQIVLAVLMYLGAAAWMALIGLFALRGMLPGAGGGPLPMTEAALLFAASWALSLTPKLAGLADVLAVRAERRRYGGAPRLLAGAALEFVLMTLLAPAVSLAAAMFMAGLPFGRTIRWDGQRRDGHAVRWREAVRGLWPQALAGAMLGAVIAWTAPGALPWAAPLVGGLLLAVPLAVLTADPALGRAARRRRICAIPEEYDAPAEVAGLAAPAARAA